MASKHSTDLAKDAIKLAKEMKEQKYLEIVANVQPVRASVVFTAGAPGAGKSEFVKSLVSKSRKNLTLDPDEYRSYFKEYNGDNSEEFNSAVTHLLSHFIDRSMIERYNLIIDTNLVHFDTAKRNIEKALKYNYRVYITYLYTEPQIAWAFVKTRSRHIKPETFKQNLILCRQTIRRLMDETEFKGKIILTALITLPTASHRTEQVVEQIKLACRPYAIETTQLTNTTVDEIDRRAPILYSPFELDSFVVY
ncbi:hypothetical protein FORC065_2488 [Yersinia enterocolitica]|nr:hypothetical protein FORC065_2488 [Yersinia enterocolitica]